MAAHITVHLGTVDTDEHTSAHAHPEGGVPVEALLSSRSAALGAVLGAVCRWRRLTSALGRLAALHPPMMRRSRAEQVDGAARRGAGAAPPRAPMATGEWR